MKRTGGNRRTTRATCAKNKSRRIGCERRQAISSSGEAIDSKGNLAVIVADRHSDGLM